MDSPQDNSLLGALGDIIPDTLLPTTTHILAKAATATATVTTAITSSISAGHAPTQRFADSDHIHNALNTNAEEHLTSFGTVPFLRSIFSFSFSVLGFMTMTVPTALYRILSWSFTLHLTFTTLLVAAVLLCFIAWAVIRYRILTKYSRLPKTDPGKHGSSFDLHPDNPFKSPQEEKENMTYPDEFLSAFLSSIKIFGYLEQPVFHELARHLQTRRMPAGDTIFQHPDLERSFYIVVDGCVQVYEQVDKDEDDDDSDVQDSADPWNDPNHNYQLLNEVKNGGTLSSMFTILSLFTENVKLRHEDEPLKEFKRSDSRSKPEEESTSPIEPDQRRKNDSINRASSPPMSSSGKWKHSSAHGTGLRNKGNTHTPNSPLSNPNHMAVFDDSVETAEVSSEGMDDNTPTQSSIKGFESVESDDQQQANSQHSHHHHHHHYHHHHHQPQSSQASGAEGYKTPNAKRRVIVARAMVDTTLAVIPAEAFHRLTQKFPQAAAHIVQVILIRFQRVTLLTGHKYLGLTKELLRMERNINEIGSYGLPPNFFRPKTMEYLKSKFSTVREESDDDDQPLAIRMKNSKKLGSPSRSKRFDIERPVTGNANSMSPTIENTNHIRHGSGFSALLDDHDEEEDDYLRDQVMECLSRSIGLVQTPPPPKSNNSLRPELKPTGSSEYFSAMFQASLTGGNNTGGYPMKKTASSNTNNSDTASLGIDDFNASNPSSTVPSVMSEMENDVEIMYFPAGASLVEEGERNAGLYFVIDGILDVTISPKQDIKQDTPHPREMPKNVFGHHLSSLDLKDNIISPLGMKSSAHKTTNSSIHNKSRHPLFSIHAGGLAGYLSALSGYPSFVTIAARTNAYVGYLSKTTLDRVMERNPTVLLTLAKRLITLVSPIVLHLDYAMEWMQVSASQVLHRQGDDCDSIYIVLNGRLRTIREKEPGKIEILNEFSQGESVGEMEVLMGTPFPSTLHAIRDTEVARMPKTLFNALAHRHPEITIRISRLIAQRASDAMNNGPNNPADVGVTPDSAINNTNLRTIGIIPVSTNVPINEFADRLRKALIGIGSSCILLNQSTVMNLLGRHAFAKIGKLKLDNWLNEQEELSQIVLYLADGGLTSPWTQTCIRQADCILLVGLGDGDPAVGDYERLLVSMKSTARKELVLLHANRHCAPGSTAAWLKSRVWVHAHHHVQMPFKGPTMLSETARKKTIMNLKDHLEKFYTNIRSNNSQKSPAFHGNRSDFARLARRLTGRTVGLVLGGGGARGIAHIGVIRALEEAGIPIDIVGGTSMGAFIGGLYARESDNVAIFGRAKMFAGRMAAKWRMVADFTYPVTSWTTGHAFNRGIWKCFSDTQIQDFWLSYYCNTTNITFSRMEMHQAGYAWRYIRASMSLSGFLPPLSDNGHMLVDGGYMDNLPVQFMKSLGANTIFAVDVGSDDDTTLHNYGDSLSGWLVLLNRWNPFSTVYRNIPNLADLQSRLAYVSSVKQLEAAKATPGSFYLKPPIQEYGTLEFSRFLEICDAGYEYGKEILEKWKKEGKLDHLLNASETAKSRRSKRVRRNSI
ncbi:phosphatidylcholine and lysophosphatidylcholine phospholipase [Mortierella sp. AM989]|nr:phosphatidylcholine and lysophosphatidylcholine phospholipase [Mortierella sp. AM989]